MHYIGMDCHITTLDFAVVNEAGRLVKANRVATGLHCRPIICNRSVFNPAGAMGYWSKIQIRCVL
jgi:hypothetical protein